jgi:2'-5' RNA ligase
MAYAINLRSDNNSASSIRELWDRCSSIEPSPSMAAMNYPPHITLAIYDEISISDLITGFDAALIHLNAVTIRFESLGYFEAPFGIVLWASPILPEPVNAAHSRIHSEIDVNLCREHYRPGVWQPHCSLATDIPLARKEEALAIVEKGMEPVEVTFDAADCASFMPVEVLKEVRFSA